MPGLAATSQRGGLAAPPLGVRPTLLQGLTITHIACLSVWPRASPRPATSNHASHATRSARQAFRPSDDLGDRRDDRSTTPLARVLPSFCPKILGLQIT